HDVRAADLPLLRDAAEHVPAGLVDAHRVDLLGGRVLVHAEQLEERDLLSRVVAVRDAAGQLAEGDGELDAAQLHAARAVQAVDLVHLVLPRGLSGLVDGFRAADQAQRGRLAGRRLLRVGRPDLRAGLRGVDDGERLV